MDDQQKALVISEVIKEEAKLLSLSEKQVHMPNRGCKNEVEARNSAVRKCFAQGISREDLCDAFKRDNRTIREILNR